MPPAAPSGLAGTAVGSSRIDLSWTDSSTTETGFTVERSDDGAQSWSVIATAGTDVTAYSDTAVSSGLKAGETIVVPTSKAATSAKAGS